MNIPANTAEYIKSLREGRAELKKELNRVLLARDGNVSQQYDYLQARIRKIDGQLSQLATEVQP